MAIYLKNITFRSGLDGEATDWLLANVGDEIRIIFDIEVKEFAINSTENLWVNNNRDGYLGQTWVTGGDFSQFDVGDEITLYNYLTNTLYGTTTIVEKLSNSEIRFSSNPASWPDNTPGANDVFSKVRPITSMVYKWNFIENGDPTNFFSKIDGTEQVATATGLLASGSATLPMNMIGPKTYQIGDITIKENGIDTVPVYTSKFRIIHNTFVTPFMLAQQWDDILSGIKPDYYINQNCLKAVFYFEARYDLTDPNKIQTLLKDDILGNTGWFNENFNTDQTKYSISNLTYTNSGFTPIDKVELKTSANLFSFKVLNPTTTPFTNGYKLQLNFAKAPQNESEYTLNTRDVRHNFVWDYAYLIVGDPAVNGVNYADLTLRSISNLTATLTNSGEIVVSGTIRFSSQGLDVFNESDEPRYMFWVSVEDITNPGANADKVSLLVDAAPFFFKTNFPDLLGITSKIIPHDIENYTDTFVLKDIFTEDELVGYSEIIVRDDFKDSITSSLFTRFTGKVIAINTVTGVKFTLESSSINVSTAPIINDAQYFDITQAKPIHVPSNEIRKNIRAYYNPTTLTYYFAYPFLNRWEYWAALNGVDSTFFNVTKPNNGFNHDWQHYNTGNWKLAYVTEIGMKVNDVPAIYTSEVRYFDNNRNLTLSDAESQCIIDTLDPDSLTPLINGSGNKYILGYKNTLVRATFNNNNSDYEPLVDITVVLGIEVFEEGGVNGKRRMSSRYVSDGDTWFIPLSGQTKVKLTNVAGATLIAEAYIDFNAINVNKNKYKLTARVYHKSDYPSSGGILDWSCNYLGDQNVFMIKDNPTPGITDVTPEVVMDCESDFIWRVLADTTNPDPLRNDKNSFLHWFEANAVETAKIYLVLNNGTEVDLTGNSTLGTPYDFGFYTNTQNEKLVGYLINWRAVISAYGECIYQIKCKVTTAFGSEGVILSDKYCVKKYTNARAENTVRIEYYFNGILGLNDNDYKVKDLGTLNWYNQHRFNGVFYYLDSPYTTDEIQYKNGQRVTVEDLQEPEYILKLKSIPAFKHDVLRTDILMSDEILITDYNSKNIAVYYKKSVRKNSEYAPKWNVIKTKLAPVEIKFKQAVNNLRKFIS